ncbi:hypothetical protein [Streptomyces sp. NPDC088736]|jgi:hypothetical protein|uniref:hypothetical protein n=1 Tax=Streptomyces sp. NPDC088736 TaxID=3365881 RepID=UPI00382CEDA1
MAVVAAAGGVVSARSARRTKRQEKRDDFTVVKDALNERIDDLKNDLTGQQEQITGQGAAISWLVVDRRSLVSTIRAAGLKTPIPRPIPERARPYLDSIDV